MVVFDRIREYIGEHTKWEFNTVVNAALNSTLSRTLNTSLTTLIVLLAIFIFSESIRGFMFALIVGVLVGTYSVFIATPVMYDTQKKHPRRKIVLLLQYKKPPTGGFLCAIKFQMT